MTNQSEAAEAVVAVAEEPVAEAVAAEVLEPTSPPADASEPVAADDTAEAEAEAADTAADDMLPANEAHDYSVAVGPLPAGQSVNTNYVLSVADVKALEKLVIANIEEAEEELQLSDQRIRTLVQEGKLAVARVWASKKFSNILIPEESLTTYKRLRDSGKIVSRLSGTTATAYIVWLPKSDTEAWLAKFSEAGLKVKARNTAKADEAADEAASEPADDASEAAIMRAAEAEAARRAAQSSNGSSPSAASEPPTNEEPASEPTATATATADSATATKPKAKK